MPNAVELPDTAQVAVSGGVIASASGVVKRYGRGEAVVTALDSIDVEFARGAMTAIMGPSGSGKSTLMHCMAGLDRPDSGTVIVDGEPVSGRSERALTRLRRTRLGFVFQSFNLIPTLNARENIELPLALARRKSDPAWFERVVEATGLQGRLSHRPNQLSGGQQQRVACARALITKPAVVFADEPTGNLDSVSAEAVMRFLRDSVDGFGQSIVLVTHDPGTAAWADRVLFLVDGRIERDLDRPGIEEIIDTQRAYAAGRPAQAG